MGVAIIIGICCLVVSVGGCVLFLTRRNSARSGKSEAAASAEATGSVPGSQNGMVTATAGGRHRWSDPRPRLVLTDDGLTDTGQQVRFCLDCSAEQTEDSSI